MTSLVRPGSDAKETRLKFILCGVTSNIFSDTQWIDDLNSFIKSPPGVASHLPIKGDSTDCWNPGI